MSCCRGNSTKYWCERHPDVYKDSDRNKYCVFHAPAGHKDIPDELFNDLIFEEIEHAITKSEPFSLMQAIIPGDIDFSRYNESHQMPPFNLREAHFEGVVNFSGVVFGGKVDLSRTEFLKEVSFLGADFKDEIIFFDSIFHKKVDLKNVTFEKIVCISWGSFLDGADMGGSSYGGKLLLKRPNPTTETKKEG
jgi:hypothetical protein